MTGPTIGQLKWHGRHPTVRSLEVPKMRQDDFSPLYRTAVGFDRLASLIEGAHRHADQAASFPPYDIEKLSEDKYRISLAVAGFGESDLEITTEAGTLTVKGRLVENDAESSREFLHKGIATRAFERRFQLAEHIRVVSASLVNGLLCVELLHEVPEAAKPRRIEIVAPTSSLELGKAA